MNKIVLKMVLYWKVSRSALKFPLLAQLSSTYSDRLAASL